MVNNNQGGSPREAGAIPILLLLAAVGLLIYLFVTNTFSFKDRLFNTLFPKPPSHAQEQSVPDEILLKFKPGVPDHAKERILNSHALQKIDSIPQIEVELVKVPSEAKDKVIEALNNNPLIEYAEPNFLGELAYEPNDPCWTASSCQWGLKKIGAAASWDITRGSTTIPIAITDSGMLIAHEDLVGKALDPWNIITGTPDVTDTSGHGTRVAGIAGVLTDNGKGIASLDWLNPIIPIKIVQDNGLIWYSDGAKAIIYAADHGAKSINMSWGGSSSSTTLQDAINYAWNKGVVLAAASGNSGTLGVLYPARANNVIAVGATDGNDIKANFSTYGPELDVTAPGVGIYGPATNGSYASGSGTSYATPFVSALATLIFSVKPTLTPQQVVDIITSTALDLGNPGWDELYGWGRIQTDKALQKASGITPPPPDTTIPTTSITQPTGGSTISGVLDITADASDNVGVTKVEFYIDGVLHATDTISPYLVSWDTTTYSNGSHSLQTKAYDLAGNVGSSSIANVTVDNLISTPTPNPILPDTTPPTVSITSPIDGSTVQRNSQVSIQADAQDNVKVAKVEFLVNNSVKCTSAVTPYFCSWRVPGKRGATYTISAKAYDSSNNQSSATVKVTAQ